MGQKYLSKCSLLKHTCSWRDKLIVTLQYFYNIFRSMYWYGCPSYTIIECLVAILSSFVNIFSFPCSPHPTSDIFLELCVYFLIMHYLPLVKNFFFFSVNSSVFSFDVLVDSFPFFRFNCGLLSGNWLIVPVFLYWFY